MGKIVMTLDRKHQLVPEGRERDRHQSGALFSEVGPAFSSTQALAVGAPPNMVGHCGRLALVLRKWKMLWWSDSSIRSIWHDEPSVNHISVEIYVVHVFLGHRPPERELGSDSQDRMDRISTISRNDEESLDPKNFVKLADRM